MSNTLLYGAEENNHSLVYFTTDESDVGSFIGDHMSSDSASFEGFDVSNQSQAYFQLLVTPSDSVTRNEVHKNNIKQNGDNAYLQQQQLQINTKCKSSCMLKCNADAKQNEFTTNTFINESNVLYPQFRFSPNQKFHSLENVGDNIQLFGSNKSTRQPTVIGQYLPQNEKHINIGNCNIENVNDTNKIANEFTVNFSGVLEDTSGCYVNLDSSQMTNKVNSQSVAPQSMIESKVQNKLSTQTDDVLIQTDDLILLHTDETTHDNINIGTTNSRPTGDKQTEKPQSQTDNIFDRETENLNFVSMFDLLLVNITSIKNEISTEIVKNKEDVKQKLTADIDAQNIFIDKKLSIVEEKVDRNHADFTDIRNDLDICKTEITDLRQEVLKNAHQVESLYTQIKVIQEGNDRLEANLAEKVMNNTININSKLENVKGEVNQHKKLVGEMSIDLKQSKDDLEELQAKYLRLEGAVNRNRVHSDQLNAQISNLTQNMISGTTKDPELIETLLRQLTPRPGTNMSNTKTATHPQEVIKDVQPSISSSPLLSPNFLTPQALINQPEIQQVPAYSKRYLTEEEVIMKDFRKKENTPSFDGSNISAPQFIEETETYFGTVNITSDTNKVNVVGSFLTGVASQWWKRVAKEVSTWDEVKNAILQQYFNNYNRKKFKQQWKEYDYDKVRDVEVFTLQAFHLLDIVKPKYTFKKKCQTVASRLPPSLMNYLLLKDFQNEQDFMNILKEAMILTNFKNDSSTPKPNNNQNGQYSNNFGHSSNYNNSNLNNGQNSNYNNAASNSNSNNSQNFNNGNNQIVTNPNFKGRPSNFDPNYKQNQNNRQHYNNGMHNNGQNNNQRTFNNNTNSNNNGRPWVNSNNNNGNRHHQRSYHQNGGNGNNSRYYHNNQGGNGQANPQLSVNNLATVPASPTSTGTTSTPITVQPPAIMTTSNSDKNQDILQLANNIFQQFLQAGWQPTPPTSPILSIGQNHLGPALSN